MSDGFDARQITATFRTSADVTINTTNTDVIWNTKIDDSTSMMNTSTGVLTVPSAGKYSFSLNARHDTGASVPGEIQYTIVVTGKNAGTYILYDNNNLTASKLFPISGNIELEMNAGDTAKITAISTTNASTLKGGASNYSFFTVKKLSSPQTTSATNKVSFIGTGATSGAVGIGTIIKFLTIVEDTHGLYNSGSGEWTVPESGTYNVKVQSRVDISSASLNQYFINSIYIDGAQKRQFSKLVENASVGYLFSGTEFLGPLVAGQKIKFQVDTNITAPSLNTSNQDTFMQIFKIK